MRLLYLDGPCSRAALSRATGRNRSTIGSLVADLVELNLVNEREPDAGGQVGRPSPVVEIRPEVAAIAVNPEIDALTRLDNELAELAENASAEDIQNIVYAIGKDEAYGFGNLRDWFKALYETLLGSEQGPRMGSFIALYGIANTRKLIAQALGRTGEPA